jgi:sugar phosphate permease
MPTLILDSVPGREAGAAVGLNGLMRSLGTTLASAVMVTLLTSSTTSVGGFEFPTRGAFQLCFLVGALAAFLGAAIAAFIPRGPGAGSVTSVVTDEVAFVETPQPSR